MLKLKLDQDNMMEEKNLVLMQNLSKYNLKKKNRHKCRILDLAFMNQMINFKDISHLHIRWIQILKDQVLLVLINWDSQDQDLMIIMVIYRLQNHLKLVKRDQILGVTITQGQDITMNPMIKLSHAFNKLKYLKELSNVQI